MLKSILMAVAACIWAVIATEIANQPGASADEVKKGADKKAAAQQSVKELLDPHLPDYLNPVVTAGSGLMIDCLVVFFNRFGFFGQFAAGLKNLLPNLL